MQAGGCVMAGAWWVWIVAVLSYALFRLWYDNWRGPVTRDEVEAFMAEVQRRQPAGGNTDMAVLRAFLEADDGREFVMSNLVRVHPGDVPHPRTGVPTSGMQLLQGYARRFIVLLLRHGGHPVLAMRKVGGYIDSWNTPPDPGWHIVGAMRYRSRRDLMAMALAPDLTDVHVLKTAGTHMTFSFPTQVIAGTALRPRVAVALLLALLAALVHLASVLMLLPAVH